MGSLTRVVYQGRIFRIEAYVSSLNVCPALIWLEKRPQAQQAKIAALFARMGDLGKIQNETKFKHLTGSDQIFEFKVDEARILSFFTAGRRLILTHGFAKRSAKTPQGEIYRAHIIKYDFLNRIKHEKTEILD